MLTPPAPPAQTDVNPHVGPKIVETTRYAVTSAPQLRVATQRGNVTVTAGDAGSIVVTVTRRGGTNVDMQAITVNAQQRGDDVTISTAVPANCTACTASIEILVPPATTVDAASEDGSVGVNGVSGDVRASSKRGPVLCSALLGNAILASEDGFVNASFSDLTHVARIKLGTANGGIRLLLPSGATFARIDAGTANGTITTSGLTLNVEKHGEAAAVKQRFGTTGPQIELGTADGPISIIQAP